MEYKRLGDYIREVNVRNSELRVTNLLGMSISKKFIPSIANTIGTDMSSYKIIKPKQFAYVPVTSRNGEKITIALLDKDSEAIISQAYTVFEITDKEKLLPEYLMMWFRRPEFDRYARFHSHGSAREVFDWDELCDVMLPVPSITRQREIVSEYETLTNCIRLNNQMIQHLEATAQALYRKTFVDNIDKENLPEGWRMGTFTEIVKICGGGTPSTDETAYWQNGEIPFYSPGDKTDSYYSLKTEKHITEEGLAHCSSKLYPQNTTFVTARGATTGGLAMAGCSMAMNQTCYALIGKDDTMPFYVHQLAIETMASLKNEAVGATFEALVTKDFDSTEILIAPKEKVIAYNEEAAIVYRNILLKQQENSKLTELQSLLLAKIGQ
jgi:type I restriction enzyme S subunit